MIHKIKLGAVLSAVSAIFLAGNVAHADDAWLKRLALALMQIQNKIGLQLKKLQGLREK